MSAYYSQFFVFIILVSLDVMLFLELFLSPLLHLSKQNIKLCNFCCQQEQNWQKSPVNSNSNSITIYHRHFCELSCCWQRCPAKITINIIKKKINQSLNLTAAIWQHENCARPLVLSIPRLFYSPMLRPSYNPNDPGHDPRGRTEELTWLFVSKRRNSCRFLNIRIYSLQARPAVPPHLVCA